MKTLKNIRLILSFIPDFVQSAIYKMFYFLFSKHNFKNKIVITSKKINNNTKNLVIVDNMRALGDFFVSLNVVRNINNCKDVYKRYVFVVNKVYQEFIQKENFKNVDFIFLESDFGTHYDRKKIYKKDIAIISNNISNQIKEYCENWNNVFFCAFSLDLTHYSILSKINYNSAYFLKHFLTKDKPKIVWQNIPVPSIPLWLYFFYFYKKFALKIWNLKFKEVYYFGKMSYDMIKSYDKNLLDYVSSKKKYEINNYLVNISIMLKTSDANKDIDVNKFINFLENLNLNKNINFYFFGKNYYNIPTSKKINVINLTGKTENLLNFLEYIKKSQLVITADTSLYHIASYFNVPAIALVNSKLAKIDRITRFWLDNQNENLIIKNRFFFKENNNRNSKKELEQIKLLVMSFLSNKFIFN